MNTVKISIESTGMDQTQAANLANFLISLGLSSEETPKQIIHNMGEEVSVFETKEAIHVIDQEKEKTTRKRAKKEVEGKTETVIEVNEPETVGSTEPEKKAITLQEIRSLVFIKKDNHKDAIKSELKRIGAESIPTISEKDYPSFFQFLENLE